jgi:hypothetical protein
MFKKLSNKHFGFVYTLGAGIFSWIFYFFLKGQLVSSAKTAIFTPEEIQADIFGSVLIGLAVILEIIGTGLKIRRIRHIKTHPELYGEYYRNSGGYASDIIFFHFIALFCTRIILSALIGYIFISLLGFEELAVIGSIAFIIKDILLFFPGTKKIGKPLNKGISKGTNMFSNSILVFSGFICMSVGWEAYGQRISEIAGTLSNWQGFGEFIVSIIGLLFFYFLLVYPTRIAYQIEEIEFVDTKKEERKLMLYYLYAALFGIIPWLL